MRTLLVVAPALLMGGADEEIFSYATSQSLYRSVLQKTFIYLNECELVIYP